MARALINMGDIVLIADANGVRDIYSADGTALDTTTPLSVLVNKGTASASEVSECFNASGVQGPKFYRGSRVKSMSRGMRGS